MLGAGLYVLYLEIFVARIIMGRMLMLSGSLIGIGGAWLVYDFVIPWWRSEEVG